MPSSPLVRRRRQDRYDVGGSRPIQDEFDPTYRIREGTWYRVPDFSSTFEPLTEPNPTDANHGFLSPDGPHAGDLPYIRVDESGNASYQITTKLVILGQGDRSLFDNDGNALLIHTQPDDSILRILPVTAAIGSHVVSSCRVSRANSSKNSPKAKGV